MLAKGMPSAQPSARNVSVSAGAPQHFLHQSLSNQPQQLMPNHTSHIAPRTSSAGVANQFDYGQLRGPDGGAVGQLNVGHGDKNAFAVVAAARLQQQQQQFAVPGQQQQQQQFPNVAQQQQPPNPMHVFGAHMFSRLEG
jgi:hypothetical protein